MSGALGQTPRLSGSLEVSLSEREGQVLRLIARGLTNNQIAAEDEHRLRNDQGARAAHFPQNRPDGPHAGRGVGGTERFVMNLISKSVFIAAVLVALAGSRSSDAATRPVETQHPGDRGRRHGILRRRLLRRRDPNAESRQTGRGRPALHAVLQYGPLLAVAGLHPHRLLCPAGQPRPDARRRRQAPGKRPAWARCCRNCSARSATARIIRASGTSTARRWKAASTSTTTTPTAIITSYGRQAACRRVRQHGRARTRPSANSTNTKPNLRAAPFSSICASPSRTSPCKPPRRTSTCTATRYLAGWDVLRQERLKRMTDLGIVNCGLGRLDPDIWPGWNLPQKELVERIGPGEVGRAIPWNTLTAEQKQFQPIKMAIHAAMIHRVDAEIGRVVAHLKAIGVSRTRRSSSSPTTAPAASR